MLCVLQRFANLLTGKYLLFNFIIISLSKFCHGMGFLYTFLYNKGLLLCIVKMHCYQVKSILNFGCVPFAMVTEITEVATIVANHVWDRQK